MKEWFKDWFNSPYYHMLYKHRNDQEAEDFVKNIVEKLSLDASTTLLDLACGKGRHSVAFASFGLDVIGVDLSENSIAFALQNETDKLHFYVQDMRSVFRTNYFDVVCNLFTSFGYFKTPHDNQLAVKSMYHSLKPGGKLLIDYVNLNHAQKNIDANPSEEIERDGIHFSIKRLYTKNRLIKKISIKNGEDIEEHEESLNSFTLKEMTDLFQAQGFQLKQSFGDYQFNIYHEIESPRMVLIFEK